MEIIGAIMLGALFGGVLYWIGAANPKNLISMLRLNHLTLMKIIVFGIGFASVLLSIFILGGIINLSHLSIKAMNLGVVLGGLIFGIGFGWAGTCPGTCVAASGTGGYKKAIAAILGGLFGAFTFTMTYGAWKATGLFDQLDWGKLTLFHLSDQYPYVFSIGSVGLLAVGILFMVIAFLLPSTGRR